MSRDWQKDSELIKIGETSDIPYGISEFKNMLPYYHQQYAAEKEHSDKLLALLNDTDNGDALKELHDYYSRRYAVERDSALEDAQQAEAREQKLREAAEKCINIFWEVTISDEKSLNSICDILTDVLDSLYPKEEAK